MPEIKVWLGGEGNCELGTRPDGGSEPGVIEALLRKVEPAGWRVDGVTEWRHIRKYRVRRDARTGENHEDIHNVRGLALIAWEAACEVLAFTRDVDADEGRADAIAQGIASARDAYPQMRIIGGCASPAIEGWILALAGKGGTDDLSRRGTLDELRTRGIDEKNHAGYTAIVDVADLDNLPNGCKSLVRWRDSARLELTAAVRGTL